MYLISHHPASFASRSGAFPGGQP